MKKEKDFKATLVKLQKPIIFIVFFSMILFLIYALVFMSPFYDFYIMDGRFSKADMASFGLDLNDFDVAYCYTKGESGTKLGLDMSKFTSITKNELQVFNHWMFNFGFFGFLISCIPFIFHSQKRKNYYLANFITNGLCVGFNLFVAIAFIIKLNINLKLCRDSFNFDVINAFKSSSELQETVINYYSEATYKWIFNLGYVVFGIMLVSLILLLSITIVKFIYQLKHKPIDTSGVKINE